MKLELLFPQMCNLYGDLFNVKYLASCSDDIVVTETSVTETPLFASEDVDMIYIGAMSEKSQELAIRALMPYRERLTQLIDSGTVFLCTGNAMEIFGKYIETDHGERIEGLELFDVYSVRRMMKRHNSNFKGTFEDMEITGFKSQFSMMYGDNSDCGFITVHKGVGINPESKHEGLRRNNFFGTYLIGPLLVLNPELAEFFLKLTGVNNYYMPYKSDLISAHSKHIAELSS